MKINDHLSDTEKLPESKYLRVGNKNFYFDIGSNDRGIFLRISEVNIHLDMLGEIIPEGYLGTSEFPYSDNNSGKSLVTFSR